MLHSLGSAQEDWDDIRRVHAASAAAAGDSASRDSPWDVADDDEEVPLRVAARDTEGNRHMNQKPGLWQMLQSPVLAAELRLGKRSACQGFLLVLRFLLGVSANKEC